MRPTHLHVISRHVAESLGLKRYFTGYPCKFGHIAERLIANNRCVACHHERDMARRSAPEQKEKRAAYDRRLWERNREAISQKNKSYYAKNRDSVNAQKRGYYEQNKQHLAAMGRKWREQNYHAVIELNTRRKKAIAAATPSWADFGEIRKVYESAKKLTAETGTKHHVDHIVPLRGKLVCGLHVHWNLRAIPWIDNLKKKNKLVDFD